MRNESGKSLPDTEDGEPEVHLADDDDEGKQAGGGVESEMVLGDLELEDRPERSPRPRRVGAGNEAITLYVEDIVKGEVSSGLKTAVADFAWQTRCSVLDRTPNSARRPHPHSHLQ